MAVLQKAKQEQILVQSVELFDYDTRARKLCFEVKVVAVHQNQNIEQLYHKMWWQHTIIAVNIGVKVAFGSLCYNIQIIIIRSHLKTNWLDFFNLMI